MILIIKLKIDAWQFLVLDELIIVYLDNITKVGQTCVLGPLFAQGCQSCIIHRSTGEQGETSALAGEKHADTLCTKVIHLKNIIWSYYLISYIHNTHNWYPITNLSGWGIVRTWCSDKFIIPCMLTPIWELVHTWLYNNMSATHLGLVFYAYKICSIICVSRRGVTNIWIPAMYA